MCSANYFVMIQINQILALITQKKVDLILNKPNNFVMSWKINKQWTIIIKEEKVLVIIKLEGIILSACTIIKYNKNLFDLLIYLFSGQQSVQIVTHLNYNCKWWDHFIHYWIYEKYMFFFFLLNHA